MSQVLDISKSLKEILEKEECVIFPGFGAFVVKYIPANIQDDQITPPRSGVSFNSRLVEDDGFLIHWVKQQINKEYSESKLFVADVIYQWKKDLSFGKTIIFPEVGKVYLDQQGNYCFEEEASNVTYEFFGLDTLNVKPVEVAPEKIVPIKPIKTAPVLKDKEEDVSGFPWRSVAAVVLPIIGLGLGVLSSMMYTPTSGFDVANLFPVTPAEEVAKTTDSKDHKELEPQKEEAIEDVDFFSKEEWALLAKHQEEQLKEKTEAKVDSTAVELAPKISQPVAIGSFHIIAGCFANRENAETYVITLQNKGFNASIIGQTPTGLYRVAYDTFDNRKDALKKLAVVKLKENRSAWLFKH